MKCRICKGQNLTEFLDLGYHPPSDAFLTKKQLHKPEKRYPLQMLVCNDCDLVQLSEVVPPEVLYRHNYPYTTGNNSDGIVHFGNLAKSISERFQLNNNDFVIDIGSNDGTLLYYFNDFCNVGVCGVDPSLDTPTLVPTYHGMWGMGAARDIYSEYEKKASVITATNVVAHVDDLDGFFDAVDFMLKDNGIFVVECPSLTSLLDKCAYDTVYHEHLSYFSPKTMADIAYRHGMVVYEYSHHRIHGGTNRYIIGRMLSEFPTFISMNPEKVELFKFAVKVKNNRKKLKQMLFDLKSQWKSIVGVSAPAKGNTLLNYCDIGPGILDYITETSDLKIGKYTPGTHIPIVPDSRLIEDQPDYALLLAWNFKDQIMGALKDYKGKWIIPIPEPHVEER